MPPKQAKLIQTKLPGDNRGKLERLWGGRVDLEDNDSAINAALNEQALRDQAKQLKDEAKKDLESHLETARRTSESEKNDAMDGLRQADIKHGQALRDQAKQLKNEAKKDLDSQLEAARRTSESETNNAINGLKEANVKHQQALRDQAKQLKDDAKRDLDSQLEAARRNGESEKKELEKAVRNELNTAHIAAMQNKQSEHDTAFENSKRYYEDDASRLRRTRKTANNRAAAASEKLKTCETDLNDRDLSLKELGEHYLDLTYRHNRRLNQYVHARAHLILPLRKILSLPSLVEGVNRAGDPIIPDKDNDWDQLWFTNAVVEIEKLKEKAALIATRDAEIARMASTHASRIAASKAQSDELKILVQRRDTKIASKNEQYAIELKSLTEKVALVATRDLTIKKIETELAKSHSLMKQLLEGTARLKRERDDQRTEMANLASQIDVLDRQAAEAESENKKALFKLEEISELENEQQVETNNIYIGRIEAQRRIIDFLAARLGVEMAEIETEAEAGS